MARCRRSARSTSRSLPAPAAASPRIAGSRIRVQDVVFYHYDQGWSPETIVEQFPHLTLADILAALAYYHDHRERIDRQVEEDEAFVEEMKRLYPLKLQQKLRQAKESGA